MCIRDSRIMMHSYESVLTMAFTGVAAANLGAGSKTTSNVFHTNRADALEDLAGERLDALVDELTPVKLLVIDEVSSVWSSGIRGHKPPYAAGGASPEAEALTLRTSC